MQERELSTMRLKIKKNRARYVGASSRSLYTKGNKIYENFSSKLFLCKCNIFAGILSTKKKYLL